MAANFLRILGCHQPCEARLCPYCTTPEFKTRAEEPLGSLLLSWYSENKSSDLKLGLPNPAWQYGTSCTHIYLLFTDYDLSQTRKKGLESTRKLNVVIEPGIGKKIASLIITSQWWSSFKWNLMKATEITWLKTPRNKNENSDTNLWSNLLHDIQMVQLARAVDFKWLVVMSLYLINAECMETNWFFFFPFVWFPEFHSQLTN